ncbi:MAG: hypothetical protein IJJ44_06055 [Solobacterium sp.]|nr:hypothetical protein [Solobacterium sp.]
MKNVQKWIRALLISSLALTGCVREEINTALEEEEPEVTLPSEDIERQQEYVTMDNTVSLSWEELWDYVQLSRDMQEPMYAWYRNLFPQILKEENTIVSPLNIWLAVSLLAEVTDGETRAQVLQALECENMEALRKRYTALWNANSRRYEGSQCLLANSLWAREEGNYNPNVLNLLEEQYRSALYIGVMGSPELDKKLQEWTDEHTGGLLRDYTREMKTDPETFLEIVSALYYKSMWNTPFSKERETEEVFHGKTKEKTCTMMHRSSSNTYYYADHFSAVSEGLGDHSAMYFFLPDEGSTLQDILEAEEFYELLNHPDTYEKQKYLIVNESIPKYTIKNKVNLREILTDLGITDIWDKEKADFTSLTDQKDIWLDKADHAAYLRVEEEGVTGAAYTELGMVGAGMPPTEEVNFVLDRPFLFILQAWDGSILFAGTITDIPED